MTPTIEHHPRLSRPVLVAIVFWLAIWVFTMVTWMYQDNGYTYGMAPVAVVLTLVGPLLVGLVLGWGKPTLRHSLIAGLTGGALFGAANMAGNLIWGVILQLRGRIPPDALEEIGGLPIALFEVVEFTVLFVVSGLILGAIGGAVAYLITRMRQG